MMPFGAFQMIFMIVFVLIVGVILFNVIKGVGQWNTNNKSPHLSVMATVVTKRINVSHHNHNNSNVGMNSTSRTSYYVTFQVESGDRMEFHISGSEYGMLVEGDTGRLTFQGTRYLGFEILRD